MAWNTEIGRKDLDEQVSQIFCELTNDFTKETLMFDIGGCADKGLYTFFSKAAYDVVKSDKKLSKALKKNGLVYSRHLAEVLTIEHAIPTKFVYDFLKTEKSISKEKIGEVLGFLKTVIITKKENKLLNSVFKSTMPSGWKWGDGVFARYEKLEQKIEIINLGSK